MAKQPPYMQMVYQAFLNNGYSPNQARAFTAEVGRENDFNPKYLFGSHWDSNRTNIGIISWNQGRRTNLLNHMRQAGLLNKDNTFPKTQAALDAQVQFLTHEIRTNKSYEETKRKFLNNPDVDYATAQRILGKNFIRWDYDGRSLGKGVHAHHAKRDRYYQQLGGTINQTPQTAPTAVPTMQATPSRPQQTQTTPLMAQDTTIKAQPLTTQQSTPNNPLSAWEAAMQPAPTTTASPHPPIGDRNETWRIKTLDFGEATQPDYTQQLAAGFGEVPDTTQPLPDYITQLARTIYDNV